MRTKFWEDLVWLDLDWLDCQPLFSRRNPTYVLKLLQSIGFLELALFFEGFAPSNNSLGINQNNIGINWFFSGQGKSYFYPAPAKDYCFLFSVKSKSQKQSFTYPAPAAASLLSSGVPFLLPPEPILTVESLLDLLALPHCEGDEPTDMIYLKKIIF